MIKRVKVCNAASLRMIFLLCLLVKLVSGSMVMADELPKGAAHCALNQPPADAGAYATPVGFLLAFPRNAAIKPDYTGCRTIWVMQSASSTPLLMRMKRFELS